MSGGGIIAGFGFRSGAKLPSLRDALAQAQTGHPAPSALAAPADKAAHLAPLAQSLGLTVIAVGAGALEAVETITCSSVSFAARRTGSVAEAVALAAAGPGACLLTARHISSDRMATCAIAQSVTPPPVCGASS